MFTSFVRWFVSPIIEDAGVDRPLRLRRGSLLMMAGGWGVFLVSCLIAQWLGRHHMPIFGWFDLLRGVEASLDTVQWTKIACEAAGGAAFFAGMFSVTLFDRLDRIPVWKAE